ncbi:MAG: DNA damage-inducible protein D [Oscillospiraceae bacterium]|jgi:DNA-damage-inducible protein D|nr:DNA damage-inducible protein D [Oscillospiraceae bacterium]
MSQLIASEYTSFEDIRKMRAEGTEYWEARELASVLEYVQWRNFVKVIDRAMLSCKNSGFEPQDHFAEVSKMIEIGKGGQRASIDYQLTRYACYLIVQNGDPRKEIIALGQTYFALQTRRAEVANYFNQLDEDRKRLVIRGDIKQWNQMLAEAAHEAGIITDKEFAEFQNAGYMGLYGGLKVADIHKRKGLKRSDKILDFMGSTELIANLFRISQAEEKLRKEGIATPAEAVEAHLIVGTEVRETIKRVGGTLPEDLPTPKRSISEVEREQLRKLHEMDQLMLDE